MLAEVTAHLDNVRIEFFKGLLVEFAKDHGAEAIVKGLRAVSDFDYELQMAQMNQQLSGIDTFFISTSPQYSFLSSSLVREVARSAATSRAWCRRSWRSGSPSASGERKAAAATDVVSDQQAYDLETILLRAARDRRDRAHDADVGVGAGEPRRDARARRRGARELPEELRHARWLLKEREEFLAQARREADDIIEAGRVQAERMVERTEVAREARRVAQQVDRRRRGRQPPAAPRGRGLHRPEAGRVRGGARAHDADGAEGPRAAPGRGRAAAAERPTSTPAGVDVRHRGAARSSTRTTADPAGALPAVVRSATSVRAIGRLLSSMSGPDGRRPLHHLPHRIPAAEPAGSRHAVRTMSALRIDVADLLTHPAPAVRCTSRPTLDGLGGVGGARLDEPVAPRPRAGARPRRDRGRGARVRARWDGECSACLRELDAELDRRVSTSSSSPTRSRARPTRSTATSSTSSSSCATRCCSSCRSRRRAPCRLRARPVPAVRRRRRRSPDADAGTGPTRGGPRSSELDLSQHTDRGAPDGRPEAQDPTGEDARSAAPANWRLDAPARSLCPNCGAVKLPHIVCGNCGWYRGRQVIDVD